MTTCSIKNSKFRLARVAAAALVMTVAATSYAAPSAEELAKLGLEGTELTPAGAIRAGNAEGTIPEWKNEPVQVPANFKSGTFHTDPFATDKVLFTINGSNYEEYADKLTEGQKSMFKTYPDYYMNVYQTRRSAVFKPYIYKAALENAPRAEVAVTPEGVVGFKNAVISWAFPIPKDGNEALMNQVTRPIQPWMDSWDNAAAVTTTGKYVVNKLSVQQHWKWSEPTNTIENFNPGVDSMFYYQTITAPAKIAGQVVLANDPVHFMDKFRSAWVYSPGQRRVKRAPQIVYDNPLSASDGLATTDQKFGFNGPNDRFNWKLLGRREIYIPYNAYKLNSGDIKVSEMITEDARLNQDLARYELHRVWVVEGTLREGTSHDYGRRVFYLDEDSWWITLMDGYDRRDASWRLQELHSIMWYDVGFLGSTLETFYDMQAGRMLAILLDNEDTAPDFSIRLNDDYFTASSIRRRGTR
ncbi:MAG: DUF1329 domain-containing protein [Gammaproteobacteria bacterium]|nr:DUF1329 domain-containing protein [Gammaproteobacteria bacterium]MBQ0840099.1 DUF1329 domain-containing protein [Gammaproteobacteria bacterium]